MKNFPLGSLILQLSVLSQLSQGVKDSTTSPSSVPSSESFNCQKSSCLKIFTLKYFFTLSIQMVVHQEQWISCYSFSWFEFSLPPGKKKKKQGALSILKMDFIYTFSLQHVWFMCYVKNLRNKRKGKNTH